MATHSKILRTIADIQADGRPPRKSCSNCAWYARADININGQASGFQKTRCMFGPRPVMPEIAKRSGGICGPNLTRWSDSADAGSLSHNTSHGNAMMPSTAPPLPHGGAVPGPHPGATLFSPAAWNTDVHDLHRSPDGEFLANYYPHSNSWIFSADMGPHPKTTFLAYPANGPAPPLIADAQGSFVPFLPLYWYHVALYFETHIGAPHFADCARRVHHTGKAFP